MINARRSEIEDVLEALIAWAKDMHDVRALALVGSWAAGGARDDSDLDVVLLTESTSTYIDHDDWLASVGGVRLLKTARWGPVTERRFALKSGLQVDLAVADPSWASTSPLDDGTRRVVRAGMRTLYDPDGLLAALAAACRA